LEFRLSTDQISPVRLGKIGAYDIGSQYVGLSLIFRQNATQLFSEQFSLPEKQCLIVRLLVSKTVKINNN